MDEHYSGTIDYEACVAYYRNALLPRRALEVRRYLEAHPDVARLARIDADHERAVAQSLDGVLQEPLPPRLQIKRRPETGAWTRHFALAATIVLSAAVGWWFGALPPAADHGTAFAERVVSAVRHPVPQDGIQTVARTPIRVSPPDLSPLGYRLVRQRRLDDAVPALIEFVYRNPGGSQLRIYAENESGHQKAPIITSHDGVSLAQWREGDTRYALVGDMPGLSLKTLADAARADAIDRRRAPVRVEPLRTMQRSKREHGLMLQPSLPNPNEAVPATVNDDYTTQPARM